MSDDLLDVLDIVNVEDKVADNKGCNDQQKDDQEDQTAMAVIVIIVHADVEHLCISGVTLTSLCLFSFGSACSSFLALSGCAGNLVFFPACVTEKIIRILCAPY